MSSPQSSHRPRERVSQLPYARGSPEAQGMGDGLATSKKSQALTYSDFLRHVCKK